MLMENIAEDVEDFDSSPDEDSALKIMVAQPCIVVPKPRKMHTVPVTRGQPPIGRRPVPTPRTKTRPASHGPVRIPSFRTGVRRCSVTDHVRPRGDPWIPRKRFNQNATGSSVRTRRPSYMHAVSPQKAASMKSANCPRRIASSNQLLVSSDAQKREKLLALSQKSSSFVEKTGLISSHTMPSLSPFGAESPESKRKEKSRSKKSSKSRKKEVSQKAKTRHATSSPIVISGPTLVSKSSPFGSASPAMNIEQQLKEAKNQLEWTVNKSSSSPDLLAISGPTLISVTKNSPFSALAGYESKERSMTPENQRSLERIRSTFSLFLSKSGSPPSERKGNLSPNSLRRMLNASRDRKSFNWNTKEYCVWCNMNGQRVELTEIDLLSLSESECIALQKVAEQRLREMDLGVSISVPKDESKLNRGKHNSSWRGVHLPLVAKNKSKKEPDRVFGIPLFRVVENDQLLRLQTAEHDDVTYGDGLSGNDDDPSTHSSSEASPKPHRRKSSSHDSSAEHSTTSVSSTGDGNDHPSTPPNGSPLNKRRIPGRGFKERRPAGYAVISPEEKTLLASLMMTGSSGKNSKQSLLPPTMPQVPYVVQKCCAHILKHGLDVTGIFRIAGAKKRVKQLRQEFDHGVDVKIDEDYHAHDVAALLKEFFRDLPEALLTKELYSAFISTAKLSGPQRLSALRCLVWLLPVPNRDTLQELLSFLATVSECSEDRIDSNGKQICGNKMSVANLSVIFGPNILHREKKTSQSGGENQYQVQSVERAEESTFVIRIVDDMIRIHKELFSIPCETHDQILRTLQESDPDAVDYLLRRKAANFMKDGGCKTPNSVDGDFSDCKTKRLSSAEDADAPEPDQSDMNNNKNNNRHSKRVDELRSKMVDTSVSKTAVVEGEFKRSSCETPSSQRIKQASISFTDEDLEEILGADGASVTSHPSQAKAQKTENTAGAPFGKAVNGNTAADSRTPPKPRPRHIQLIPEPAESKYSRRKAFSLDPRKEEPRDKQEQSCFRNRAKGISGRNKVVDSDQFSPKEHSHSRRLISKNSTSGFVDMSSSLASEISENSMAYYDDTKSVNETARCQRNADFHGKESSYTDVSSPEESVMRKRIPSALHLHINRMRGTYSSVPLHSLRIPKTFQGRKCDEELESSNVSINCSNGRRLSKDDMYLTLQEFNRRNDTMQNVFI